MSESETESTEVTFNVVVLEEAGVYGVTLYADDGLGNDDEEGVPCWRTAFRGKPGADVDSVSEMYADCHQDAMDAVGIDGPMDAEEWLDKMRKSVVLAGELMSRFGYRMMPTAEVSPELAEQIFEGVEDWPGSAPVDISKLN